MNKITKKHLKENQSEILEFLKKNVGKVIITQTAKTCFEYYINSQIVLKFKYKKTKDSDVKFSYIFYNIDILINFLESKKFKF